MIPAFEPNRVEEPLPPLREDVRRDASFTVEGESVSIDAEGVTPEPARVRLTYLRECPNGPRA